MFKALWAKLDAIHADVLEIKKTLELLREVQPGVDITDGISSIMSYDGKGKGND